MTIPEDVLRQLRFMFNQNFDAAEADVLIKALQLVLEDL